MRTLFISGLSLAILAASATGISAEYRKKYRMGNSRWGGSVTVDVRPAAMHGSQKTGIVLWPRIHMRAAGVKHHVFGGAAVLANYNLPYNEPPESFDLAAAQEFSSRIGVGVFGVTVQNNYYSGQQSGEVTNFGRIYRFFNLKSAKFSFMVGPVPFSVENSITLAGFLADGRIKPTVNFRGNKIESIEVEGDYLPNVQVLNVLSFGPDIEIVNGGLEGTITLLSGTAGPKAKFKSLVNRQPGTGSFSLFGYASADTLSGALTAYVEGTAWGNTVRLYEKKLIEWGKVDKWEMEQEIFSTTF